jgi:hypothetical protein
MFVVFTDAWLFPKVFIALGNDRPQILVDMEDKVLQAIISICEGKSRDDVIKTLSSELRPLETKLIENEDALTWFDFSNAAASSSSTPPPCEARSDPLPGALPLDKLIHYRKLIYITVTPKIVMENFPGLWQLLIAE